MTRQQHARIFRGLLSGAAQGQQLYPRNSMAKVTLGWKDLTSTAS
jgi:hypothetical protein